MGRLSRPEEAAARCQGRDFRSFEFWGAEEIKLLFGGKNIEIVWIEVWVWKIEILGF